VKSQWQLNTVIWTTDIIDRRFITCSNSDSRESTIKDKIIVGLVSIQLQQYERQNE
jgi:hypothetical protein